jgi:hypothetical protein
MTKLVSASEFIEPAIVSDADEAIPSELPTFEPYDSPAGGWVR